MAWVSVDKDGTEKISPYVPERVPDDSLSFRDYLRYEKTGELYKYLIEWVCIADYERLDIILPVGSIKKLIGYPLTWEDEPVELKSYE